MLHLKNILIAVCSVSVITPLTYPTPVTLTDPEFIEGELKGSLTVREATDYHAFLWGMYSVARGADTASTVSFEHIALDDTTSVPLTKMYIVYAYQAKQYAYVAHKQVFIKNQCADDQELSLMLARSYEHLARHHEADAYFAVLEKKYPDNAEIMYHAIRAHIRGQRLYQALACAETFTELHKDSSANAVFYYIQAQIYQLLNKHDEAIKQLEQCIALSPRFEQGWFLWALLHEKMSKTLQVQRGYTQFLDIVGSDPVIEKKVLGLLLSDVKNSGISWYDRAALAFFEREYSKALLLLDVAEKNEKKHDACVLLKIQIFDVLQRYDDLFALFKNLLIKNPDNELWLRTFHTFFLKSIYTHELMDVLNEIMHKKPGHQRLMLYALDCAVRMGNYKTVVQVYKKLVFKPSDTLLKAQVLYQVGACAYEHRDWGLVRQIAQQVYKDRYQYAPLLNFAAYYYSKYEQAHDKAQTLLDAALALDPQNAHFLDTQAYIYVQTGKKEQAVTLLQSLVRAVPLDKKIRRHRKKARQL